MIYNQSTYVWPWQVLVVSLIIPITAIVLSFVVLAASGTAGCPQLYLLQANYSAFNDIRKIDTDRYGQTPTPTHYPFTLVGLTRIVSADFNSDNKIHTVKPSQVNVIAPRAQDVLWQLKFLYDSGINSGVDQHKVWTYTRLRQCNIALFSFLLLTAVMAIIAAIDLFLPWSWIVSFAFAFLWFLFATVAAALCTANFSHANNLTRILRGTGIFVEAGRAPVSIMWVVVGLIFNWCIASLFGGLMCPQRAANSMPEKPSPDDGKCCKRRTCRA